MAAMLLRFTRLGLSVLILFGALSAFASAAGAAELVMFRRDGCPYCAVWEREIGPIYPKTAVGRRAPLRVVDLDRGDSAAVHTQSPILYTPTFVLVANGKEVGRIEGYPGDAFFWGLLERLLDKLPPDTPDNVTATSAGVPPTPHQERAL